MNEQQVIKIINNAVQSLGYLQTQTYHYFKVGNTKQGLEYATKLAHLARLILA